MARLWFFSCMIIAISLATLTEAQSTGVFFSEGWESGTAAPSFNSESYGVATSSQFTVQSAIRAAGNYALQRRLVGGTASGAIQYATQHFGDAPSGPIYAGTAGRRYDDLYVQFKIYYAPGFDTSNIDKQLIIGTQDDRRHSEICCNPWVAHYLTIFPVLGTRDLVAELNNKQSATSQWWGFRQNASGYGPGNRFATQPGVWNTIEVRRRLNDIGVDNGIFQMWINGTLIADHRTARYRTAWNGTVGSNPAYGTNFVMISDYALAPITRDESLVYDDIKFSTTYIGVGTSELPQAPRNLRILPGDADEALAIR